MRGVALSHADLLAAAETLVASEDIRQTDDTLAWQPMAWFGDVISSQALALRSASPATARKTRKPRVAICVKSGPQS